MKKFLSIMLAILMVVTMLPIAVMPVGATGAQAQVNDNFKAEITRLVYTDSSGTTYDYTDTFNSWALYDLALTNISDGKCQLQYTAALLGSDGVTGWDDDSVTLEGVSCDSAYTMSFEKFKTGRTGKWEYTIQISKTVGHAYSDWSYIDDEKHSRICAIDTAHTINGEHSYNNGFCDYCNAYQSAELNENGYYEIGNAGQLFWYANYINTVDRTANAVLVADIDLENRPWTPIGATGENSNNFRGIFDGQNYTIRGLYVEGDRAGLGFFGEVRTGTVKNFIIFGEVVVNTEVDYVGGVIGSICGVNGETDLERNGAIIQNINSYVNLTVKAHGVGKIGGFVGYANHQSLIEHCAWYGTFDAGEYRVDSGAGGFIGKIQENSSEVTIRNCAAYGTIKTNYAGDYNDTSTIYMGGFLSFSNTNAKTTVENCLFAGRFECGENLTDQAFLGAFGTLRSVKAIKNCYYLGDDGLEAVHSDSNLNPESDNVEISKVTEEQLKSGEIATQLGKLWTQGEDYPILKELSPHSHSYTYTDNGDGTHDQVCPVCDYVEVDDEAHTPADNATYTDNNDGTHSFTCGDCGATVSDNHSGGTATCKTQAVCEVCGTSYGELDPDNHDFGSGNTCICGAEIAFTGIVVDDENSDEYRYDETRKTYTIIIPADEVGGIGYLSYDIIGTNLTLIEDTNTLLKVQHENEDGLTSAPDNLLVDVLQDNGYFGWSVLGYGDGEWEKLLYSNDGGMTWTTYTFEVKQAYSITVNASQNGTVTANEYAIEGDNIALNVSPAEGYMLDTLSVTDASGNSVDVENNAFTMPASAVTVTATFAVCDHKDGRHETATDNGDGTHSFTCAVCGNITEEHAFDENGTCVCGVNLFSVSGSTLTIDGTLGGKTTATEDDVYTLVEQLKGYVDSGITTIIVTGSEPALYNFYGIDTSAVSAALYYLADGRSDSPYCGTIDLILPDVTEIVDDEFNNTFALNSITLPKVTKLGALAFYAARWLQTITFGSVLTDVNETGGVMFAAVGEDVGGCDLILNCGQMNESSVSAPDLSTNIWKFRYENEFKSIALTHNGGEATCITKAVCETCGEEYGDIDATAHSWANLDGICANGCGATCAHENQTGETCEICGAELHICDFSGEWKYDADKHWKECTADGCDKISEDAEHSFTDGKCDCGYTCPHEWGEGVLTRPERVTTTDWDDGYYTYTCSLCGHYYQETVKRADYSVLDAILEDFIDAMYDTTLLDSIRNELEVIYFDNIKVLYGDYIESEQAEVDALVETMTQKLAEVEAGVADGSALKPDYTEGDALINGIIEQFYDKGITYVDEIVAEFDTLYNEYLAIWHKPETTKPQVDEIVEELKALKEKIDKGTEDGTLIKADYTEINKAIKEIEDKFFYEGVTDEGKAGLEEIKKRFEAMKADENTSAADVAEFEKEIEAYEEELDKGIEDGTLVMIRPEKIVAEFSDKWNEKLEAEGLLDERDDFINNQKFTDEALAAEKETIDFMASLEGTVAENAENIAKLNEMNNSFTASFENCLRGTHNFKDYEVTSPAKCEVNAIETRTCWFCGETDEREVEGTALSHSFTKYEVTEEAKCGVAGKEVAYCDNGCQTTDERETPALEHIFLDYVSNGDATCTADGTKTASCIHGCGTTDTVADEASMLDHSDEDGDKLCDDCGEEVYDRCDICGGKAHGDDKIQLLFCMIITIVRFVTFILKSIT